MKTVIAIKEENHGIIGCVETKDDVLPWLIQKYWVNGYFEEYNPKTNEYTFLIHKYGPNWQEYLEKMNWDELNLFFEGAFSFHEVEVWSAS